MKFCKQEAEFHMGEIQKVLVMKTQLVSRYFCSFLIMPFENSATDLDWTTVYMQWNNNLLKICQKKKRFSVTLNMIIVWFTI